MADIDRLWDFDDPAASEERFRQAAEAAEGSDKALLTTQVARALGLQELYDDGHALLDVLRADRADQGAASDGLALEVEARIELERGRLLRSAGRPEEAAERFEEAATLARASGNEVLVVDVLHMQALLETEPAAAVRANRLALDHARGSADAAARWEPSLLNNLGCALVDDGQPSEALAVFQSAVPLREARGERRETQIARWMVAWTLRLLGRTDEALRIQRALKAELEAQGAEDPYVDEELSLLGDAP